jgi:hypothetical protein
LSCNTESICDSYLFADEVEAIINCHQQQASKQAIDPCIGFMELMACPKSNITKNLDFNDITEKKLYMC